MLNPLKGEIIVELIEPETETKSGLLVIPDKMQPIPNRGIVYAIASDIEECKVGQEIVFKENHPKGFKFDDKKLLKIKKEQLMGVFS